MKNTKNNSKYLLKAFFILAIIVIITLALTLLRDESSPSPESQIEQESINLTMPPPMSAETMPFVTTVAPPIISTESPATNTTPLVTTTISPVTTTPPVTTTTTPPVTTTSTIITITTLQIPENAQGTDEYGFYYKIEDGQRYIWNHVVGWCRDDGPGEVTIMDVQSDGHRFYREPDGTVNLDKIITPDGSVISFDEYQRIRESR
jgi:hypothetical protein